MWVTCFVDVALAGAEKCMSAAKISDAGGNLSQSSIAEFVAIVAVRSVLVSPQLTKCVRRANIELQAGYRCQDCRD